MSIDDEWREREADLRSEYEMEAAYEASADEPCDHDYWGWEIVRIADLETHDYSGVSLPHDLLILDVKCVECGYEHTGWIEERFVLQALNEHNFSGLKNIEINEVEE